jgi:ABC-type polysaccharide/polyol phosphate export permease
MTAAIVTAIILAVMLKREFVKHQISTFSRFKYLLGLLVKRDFQSRYRKSVLGVLWSLLNPLLTMLVMTMVFSYMFKNEIENFPVYLLSGLVMFGFFNESTTSAMGSVVGGGAIIKKVYVPKYIFPISRVLSSLVNMFFSLLAFVLVAVVTRAPFHWTIFLIPIPIVYVFVFSLGMAMLLSSLVVFFRDLSYLYGIILTLWMYLTPLFYPVSRIPERLMPFYGLNPMYQFVDYFRNLALYGTIPGMWTNAVCAGFALAALCVGTYTFMTKQDRYILYL